ncbi:inhibitor of cysteine peptidase [Ruminiclostridium sufflavum DSM 19573]|uniref:cellulase n=1 Tax=Ruminiclostridium sufflavum DSM 19573 TaxID=1121337 RepID=A0A318XVU8_9FIRM|nr:protease inhibitor I42 family protein [Ruminiclostridium sufflavum]PYG86927.1 inhibitor of cysteine peptidase [Ruminiclostridium sufflavum DSM 19573]
MTSNFSIFARKSTAFLLSVIMLSCMALPAVNSSTETYADDISGSGIYNSILYGDLNKDLLVDSLDFVLLKKLLSASGSTFEKAADLNGDNAVNALDLSILKQFLLGSLATFPVANAFKSTETGSTINIAQNSTFEISLEENPSTGYEWSYSFSEDQAASLISESSFLFSPNTAGTSIHKIWSFEALKPGTYTLTYEYSRPWEEAAEPVATVQCTINISNPNENIINVSTNELFKISMQEGGLAGFTSTCRISDETGIKIISQAVNNPNPQISDWLYSRVYTFKALNSGKYEIVFTPKPIGKDIVYVINVK